MALTGGSVFVPVDGRLSVEQLERLAAEFDGMEPGAHYSARAFARWIRQEAKWRQATAERPRFERRGA